MVGFTLNEEQEALRSTVADFARAEVAPVIGDYYERGEFPYPVVAKMGKLGLFGLPFPEDHGGMGGDYFAFCLALHELGRVDSSVAITLEAAVGLGAMPIYRYGSPAQQEQWLPPLCRGERLAAFGLTEPGGGSDIPGGMRTTARRDGDEWVIDGSKSFITNSGTSITSVVTVLANSGSAVAGTPAARVPEQVARGHPATGEGQLPGVGGAPADLGVLPADGEAGRPGGHHDRGDLGPPGHAGAGPGQDRDHRRDRRPRLPLAARLDDARRPGPPPADRRAPQRSPRCRRLAGPSHDDRVPLRDRRRRGTPLGPR